MSFKFLHTADWHIGRAFGGFAPDTAAILKRARLTVVDRLAAAARGVGAGHVVVCGDVFDGPGLPDRVLAEALAKLNSHPDVRWHLLPGNHDPASMDGIWHRLARFGLPANVEPLLEGRPKALNPSVSLLPAPLQSKSSVADPTAWMDAAPSAPGVIRIGVAHGATQGFGGSSSLEGGIDARRRSSAGLDYLALGDWHGKREIADGVWYSGTPEPDQFPDNEPGFALVVELTGVGAAPRVTAVATAAHVWIKLSVRPATAIDLSLVEQVLAELGPRRGDALLELTLHGIVSLDGDADISARLAAIEPGLLHLRCRRNELVVDAGAEDLAEITDPNVAAVARQLLALRADPTEADVAAGALRRLFQLNRAAAGGAS